MYTCMRRYNPYLSDSSEGSEDEDDEDDELRQLNVRHAHPHTLSIFKPMFFFVFNRVLLKAVKMALES